MKKTSTFFTLCCLLVAAAAQAQPTKIFVRQNAAGNNNGTSWAHAYTRLQDALAAATDGDTLWVAAGTYTPTSTNNRSASFLPPSGIRMFGGFAGTEALLSMRDIAQHPTVLSGDIGTPGDSLDNSYNIMYMVNPDSGTVLDGFVFRDGVADSVQTSNGNSQRTRCGAALYIMAEDGMAYPAIRNCRFEHNTARTNGGAVFVHGGGIGSVAPTFEHCVFERNLAWLRGGAVYRNGGSWAEREKDFYGCLFDRNTAYYEGGSLYLNDTERTDTIDIKQCVFKKSLAERGGVMWVNCNRLAGQTVLDMDSIIMDSCGHYNLGAVMVGFSTVFGQVGQVRLSNFQYSHSENIGLGDFYGMYAAITIFAEHAEESFTKGRFYQNRVRELLKVGIDNHRFTLEHIDLSGNTIGHWAPTSFIGSHAITIYIASLHDSIKDITFDGNFLGGGIYSFNVALPILENIRCTDNHAHVSPLFSSEVGQQVVFNNSLFYNNTVTAPVNSAVKQTFRFTNSTVIATDTTSFKRLFANADTMQFEHCYLSPFDPSHPVSGMVLGAGNLYGFDPLFRDTAASDFRLQPCSPLVGAGKNQYVGTATDLDGHPRILGGTVDIGPYELPDISHAAAPQVQGSCAGAAGGSVAFLPENACPPFSVAWQQGASSGQGSSGLAPGSYAFTLTDSRGRTLHDTVLVPALPPLAVTPLMVPVFCGDTVGGTAQVVPLNGTAPFAYQWQGGSTAAQATGLAKGTYAYTVTDAALCRAVGTVNVGTVGQVAYAEEMEPVGCYGGTDGSVRIVPQDGKAPFAYQWVAGSQTDALSMVAAGVYGGTLTDALGCEAAWSATVEQPDSLHLSAQIGPASGAGVPDGSIAVQATGGTGGYTYQWSNGATGTGISNVLPGNYRLTLTDANGCDKVAVLTVPYTMAAGDAGQAPDAWQVYPNPADGQVQVSFVGQQVPHGRLRCQLTDALGRVVLDWAGQAPAVSFSVRDLPGGHYWLTVEAAGWKGRKGIVVVHGK